MLCEKCKSREAGIHFAAFHDGRLEAHHLCLECASELVGDLPSSAADFQHFLQHLEEAFAAALPQLRDAQAASGSDAPDAEDPDLPEACPACSLPAADLLAGRRGCPVCYSIVRRSSRIPAPPPFRGPPPPGLPPSVRRQALLLRLRARLRDALASRDYEAAAKLHSAIQSVFARL